MYQWPSATMALRLKAEPSADGIKALVVLSSDALQALLIG
jgi:hypothetical protein